MLKKTLVLLSISNWFYTHASDGHVAVYNYPVGSFQNGIQQIAVDSYYGYLHCLTNDMATSTHWQINLLNPSAAPTAYKVYPFVGSQAAGEYGGSMRGLAVSYGGSSAFIDGENVEYSSGPSTTLNTAIFRTQDTGGAESVTLGSNPTFPGQHAGNLNPSSGLYRKIAYTENDGASPNQKSLYMASDSGGEIISVYNATNLGGGSTGSIVVAADLAGNITAMSVNSSKSSSKIAVSTAAGIATYRTSDLMNVTTNISLTNTFSDMWWDGASDIIYAIEPTGGGVGHLVKIDANSLSVLNRYTDADLALDGENDAILLNAKSISGEGDKVYIMAEGPSDAYLIILPIIDTGIDFEVLNNEVIKVHPTSLKALADTTVPNRNLFSAMVNTSNSTHELRSYLHSQNYVGREVINAEASFLPGVTMYRLPTQQAQLLSFSNKGRGYSERSNSSFDNVALYAKEIAKAQQQKQNRDFSIWVSGYSGYFKNRQTDAQFPTTDTVNGVVTGFEYRSRERGYSAGISLAVGLSKSERDDNETDYSHHHFTQVGVYGDFQLGKTPWRLEATAAVGRTKTSGKRNVVGVQNNPNLFAFSKPRTQSLSFGGRLNYEGEAYRPYFGANYSLNRRRTYTETEAGRYNQTHQGQIARKLELFTGVYAQREMKVSDERHIIFSGELMGQYSPVRTRKDITRVSFTGLRPNYIDMDIQPDSPYTIEIKGAVSLTNKSTYQTTLQIGGVCEEDRRGVTLGLTQRWNF